MQEEPLPNNAGCHRICELCDAVTMVVEVVVARGSYLLTMGRANVLYDLEMELRFFWGKC